MIIFYNKKTGEVIGMIQGRVHDPDILEKAWIQPSGISPEDIGKYVVPFKTIYTEEDQPIVKRRVNLKTGELTEVVTGYEKVKKGTGMVPDVSFADLINDFESGKESVFKHNVLLDKKGSVRGFKKVI